MQKYASPSCEVDFIEQEKAFLASVVTTTDDYPLTPSKPFHSRSMSPWEEDDDE